MGVAFVNKFLTVTASDNLYYVSHCLHTVYVWELWADLVKKRSSTMPQEARTGGGAVPWVSGRGVFRVVKERGRVRA